MATREPIEDQNHEAGDETYAKTTNKFIDSNDNDQQQDDSNDDEHQAPIGEGMEAEPEYQRMERNGQSSEDAAASMGSNDTPTTSTSATSDSVNNSQVRTPTSNQEQRSSVMKNVTSPQSATQESASAPGTSKNDQDKPTTNRDDDEELEEGELKDDDDDSDDDIPADNNSSSNNTRFSTFGNEGNDNNNNGGLPKDAPFVDQRMHDQHQQNNSSGFSGRGGGGHGPAHQFRNHHQRRHMSPNQQQQHLPPGMHPQYPPNQPFGGMSDDYRFPPNHDGSMNSPMAGMPPHMAHPMAGPAGPYPRGGPGPAGPPMPKVNVRCRFYSRTSNKCTWGDHCRFEHRDDSPGPNDVFDDRMPGPGMPPMPMRGPPPPHMGSERPYPAYPTRHQPYPGPPQPYGYGAYDQPPFGPQHSASPPLPHHGMPPQHWRQQHSPYPSPSSSNQPPESISPSLNPAGPGSQSAPGVKPPNGGPAVPPAPSSRGSPGYSSPSSSAVYERKHRLAYELAPWNDRGYPPPSKYDRDPGGGYPPAGARGGYYRNHYSRDPYGREPPPPHMGGPSQPHSSSGLPSYPSAYRGSPMGPYPSSHRYSSQRGMPPDLIRSRSNKRGHDEDESSWSDSGSEDSILGQTSSGNKSSANKSKKHQRTTIAELDEGSPKEHADQGGSGTPPGEPLPEDRERQEMLLNKLKEIEDLMAKKKGEQEDPM